MKYIYLYYEWKNYTSNYTGNASEYKLCFFACYWYFRGQGRCIANKKIREYHSSLLNIGIDIKSCKCESCRAGNTPLFLQPKHLDKSENIILKKKKIKNAWLIEISSDFKLIDISEKYSIAKGGYNSPTIEEEKKFYLSVGYSINTDGNLYTFDNIVIGLDLTGVYIDCHKLKKGVTWGYL